MFTCLQLHRVQLSGPGAIPSILGHCPYVRKLALSELEWVNYDDRSTSQALVKLPHLQELRLQCSDPDRTTVFSALLREYFIRSPDSDEVKREIAQLVQKAASGSSSGVRALPDASAASGCGGGGSGGSEPASEGDVSMSGAADSTAATTRAGSVITATSGRVAAPTSLPAATGTAAGGHRVYRAVSDSSITSAGFGGSSSAASTGATPAYPLFLPPLEPDLFSLSLPAALVGGSGGDDIGMSQLGLGGGGDVIGDGGMGSDVEVIGSPAGAGYNMERDRRGRAASVTEGCGWLGLLPVDGPEVMPPPSQLLPILYPFRNLRKLTLLTRLDEGAVRALVQWILHPLASRRLTKLKLSVPLINASAPINVPLPAANTASAARTAAMGIYNASAGVPPIASAGNSVIGRSRSASYGGGSMSGSTGHQQAAVAVRTVTLIQAIGMHMGLQKLTIVRPDGAGEVLRQPQCREIGSALASSPSLWSLHLRRCGLWADSLAALVPPWTCPRVTSIKLDGNSLGYLSGELLWRCAVACIASDC